MNNQSPLVPQGSLVDQKNKGRARVKIAVFFVLAIHGIGLLALLMQGCRRDEKGSQNENTNEMAPSFQATNAVVADTNAPLPGSTSNVVAAPLPETTLVATEQIYTVKSGDNLSTIASQFHTTVRA